MHVLKELLSLEIRGWTGEHCTIFCFHCDKLRLLRMLELTESSCFYIIQSMPAYECKEQEQTAAWMLGAMQLHKGFLLHRPQQCGCSIAHRGSAACGSTAAVRGAVITSLPCPAVHSTLHQTEVFHSSALPEAAATPPYPIALQVQSHQES